MAEETGLPVFDIRDADGDPFAYDFLVLGSSIVVYKPTIRRWLDRNLTAVASRPVLLYTVSGAPPGEKLSRWVREGLPPGFADRIEHFAFGGRQIRADLTLWDRLVLWMGAMRNPDPKARRDELEGFDYMDRSAIAPLVAAIRTYQADERVAV